LYRQFPDALGMMVRSLRVGRTVTQALRDVARDAQVPTNTEFDRLADRLAIGVPLSEAISEMATQSGITEYRFFATTLLLQYQTGGSLTEALDGLAEVIRGRVALRRRGHALASEARTSAIVLGILPIFTGVALAFLAPDYFRLLIEDPIGRRVLAAATCMLLMGTAVMQVMTSRVLQ
jgi:tight adherence protein B